MAGTLTLGGTQTGAAEGTRAVGPVTITMGTAGVMTELVLQNGDNTITVPATAVGCLIIPSPTNTQVLKIKGVGGDTGIIIGKTNPFILTFDATPIANFIINAAALSTGTTAIVFF